jgi:membrane protease YdiL (CAAX protease family)
MTLTTTLLASLIWGVAFFVGRLTGQVHAALVPVALVLLVVVVARDPDRGRRWWAVPPSVLVGDVVVGVVVGVASVLFTHAAFPPLRALFPSLGTELVALTALAGATTPTALVATAVVALAEEALWRGAMDRALVGRLPVGARVVVVAVVYGLAQAGAGSGWLVVAAVGLGALWHGLVVGRGGRLVAAVVAHLVWTLGILGFWPLR